MGRRLAEKVRLEHSILGAIAELDRSPAQPPLHFEGPRRARNGPTAAVLHSFPLLRNRRVRFDRL